VTLPEILHEAIRLLDASEDARVVIARGARHELLDGRGQSYQVRLRRDTIFTKLFEYRCETRGWLGEQWSSWHERRGWLGGAGFDIADVLATDWCLQPEDPAQ
jgi:hypothetical protein